MIHALIEMSDPLYGKKFQKIHLIKVNGSSGCEDGFGMRQQLLRENILHMFAGHTPLIHAADE